MSGDRHDRHEEQRHPRERHDVNGGPREHDRPEGRSREQDREHGQDRNPSQAQAPDRVQDRDPSHDRDPAQARTREPDLPDLDEQALRALLRDVVRDVEPSPESLERLRHAVPARRARRRQVIVGAAAAAFVVGAATPALVHAGVVSRVLNGTTNAASSQRQDEGRQAGGQSGSAETSGSGENGALGGDGDPRSRDADASGNDGESGPDANDTLAPTSPSCLRSQLGDAGPTVGAPDANGHVYGSFRITNVSGDSCRVEGPDTVSATAQGDADPSGISVVNHTPGDPAAGLPDPQLEPRALILEPGQTYVVRFAWIPRAGGGTTGCRAPDPTPTPGGSTGGSGDTGSTSGSDPGSSSGGTDTGGTDTGGTGTGGTDTGGVGDASGGQGSDGSGTVVEPEAGPSPQLGDDTSGGSAGYPTAAVVLRYVPGAGEPRIGRVTLNNACAGTVYRTGLLAS